MYDLQYFHEMLLRKQILFDRCFNQAKGNWNLLHHCFHKFTLFLFKKYMYKDFYIKIPN